MEPMVNISLKAAWDAENMINRQIDRSDLLKVWPGKARKYVTNLEKGVEEAILTSLRQVFPEHSYLTPESGLMEGSAAGGDYLWIVDPLSGSENLVRGIPHFAFSISLQIRERTEHVLIVDPIRRERFSASRGQGARLNDSRIRVSGRKGLADAGLAVAWNTTDDATANNIQSSILRRTRQEGTMLRESGCVSLDLAYIAAGRLDGGWVTGHSHNELIAGAMLIAEAGGLTTDFEGDQHWEESGNLVCASPKLLKPLLQIIRAGD